MASGGPEDHPLYDVINYNIDVYGTEASNKLRKLSTLMSDRELLEWWQKEINWNNNKVDAARKIDAQYSLAEERAKSSGWEL